MEEILKRLQEQGIVDEVEIQKAKEVSLQKNQDFLKVLSQLLPEKEREILKEVSLFYKLPYLELSYLEPDLEASYVLPEDFVRAQNILPLFKIKDWFFLGISLPLNLSLLSEIKRFTHLKVKLCLLASSEIESGIDRLYRAVSSAEKIVQKIETIGEDVGSSVVQLINLLIAQAVRDRTSDIHIEPEPDKLRIRFRIDGVLHEVPSPPKSLEPAIVSRIKVMANLDIAESRLPQDGHFKVNVDRKEIDLRVSTLPTVNGENVVLRILDVSNVLLGLEKLGFLEDSLNLFRGAILRPYGMILTTGPTGSGKTTTLYSALMELNTIEKNIVTIEDPVEYRLPLIRQVQINPRAGLTFASGLRSILRHDPDIIMVGEIRDLETATIAVQSALTGHLVFSTLHTNDAPSAITRLTNMGLEPYLISASLIAVMAQRLVRRICPDCKVSQPLSESIKKRFGLEKLGKEIVLYKGKGCDFCKGTGYKGRIGIFEIMLIDDEIREMIVEIRPIAEIREKAHQKGMRLLFEDGLEKVLKGITTLDEVSRVCEERVELKEKRESEYKLEPYLPPAGKKEEMERGKPFAPKPEEIESYTKKILDWISKKK